MKITKEILEAHLNCKFKGHLKLAGQQGTKCDFEAMLTGQRAEVRLKAIDAIIARPKDGRRVSDIKNELGETMNRHAAVFRDEQHG